MGVPVTKILQVVGAVSGVALPNSDKERLAQEAQENQLLAELIKGQQVTNAILLRILADDIGEEEFDEFVKSL